MIDELVIFAHKDGAWPERSIAVSNAEYGGVGRPDDSRRYKAEVKAYNERDGEMLFHLKGLRFFSMEVAVEKPHTLLELSWAEDFHFLTTEQISNLLVTSAGISSEDLTLQRVAKLIDTIAHKTPTARFLEVSLQEDKAAVKSLWIDELNKRTGLIAQGCYYQLSMPSHKAGLDAREQYATAKLEHAVHDPVKPFPDTPEADEANKFDVVIVRVAHTSAELKSMLESAKNILTSKGYLICLQDSSASDANDVCTEIVSLGDICPQDFNVISGVEGEGNVRIAFLGTPSQSEIQSLASDKKIHLLHFNPADGSTDAARDLLTSLGWETVEHAISDVDVPEGSTVLVMDEMFSPVISGLGDDGFNAIKLLITRNCRVLWVTMG
jgi:hypothetical protein